jgi:hypothetical protein
MESDQPAEDPLVCAECGAVSEPEARDWRAYLDEDGQAVTFCPECAEREFGEACAPLRLWEPPPIRLDLDLAGPE